MMDSSNSRKEIQRRKYKEKAADQITGTQAMDVVFFLLKQKYETEH